MSVIWKDISRYGQNEKLFERKVKTVTCKIGNKALIVSRHIHFDPNQWVATFDGFFHQVVIGNQDLETAKIDALALAITHVSDLLKLLQEAK